MQIRGEFVVSLCGGFCLLGGGLVSRLMHPVLGVKVWEMLAGLGRES
jgi:hypothetical protein